ncbi:CDP-glycerol glycerophosphotransferase family protein [Streptomyces litchfieldiae]|uniref:CDP-glycerol glycerophosphotransferase family protein n=1 Tax=Streptomyces litchfieldiae TaxID=3075543 RepID=A0ABU2MMB6_9ACTN|nr:CDP-glycerol glycerophosphotransferase family protein [Streptomyces sp. DSM 44938]MDT0342740.1 CDP-glycerol glycerophosphotransferase family protein [Streptomyces sp. DSM 44938]
MPPKKPAKKPEDILPADLRRSMHWLPESSAEEREEFFTAAGEFLASADPRKLRKLPPLMRVKWQLARERRLDDLLTVLSHEREFRASSFLVSGKLRPRLEIPGLDSGSLPADVVRLGPGELPVRAKATEVLWVDGRLVVRGYAFVQNVPVDGKALLPRFAWLRQQGARRRVPVRVKARTELRATRDSGQALHAYDEAGFEIVIDPKKLRTGGQWQPGVWQLTLALPSPGVVRTGSVDRIDIGSAGHSQARELADGVRLLAGFSDERMQLTIETPAAEVAGHEETDDALRLALHVPGGSAGQAPARLLVEHKGGEFKRAYDVTRGPGGAFTADIPFADLSVGDSATAATQDFITTLEFPDGTTRRATVRAGFRPGQYLTDRGREIAVTTDGPGLLKLHDRRRQAVVDELHWTPEGELVLSGVYTGATDGLELVLRHGKYFEEKYLPFESGDGRFTLRLTPDRMPSYDGDQQLREGRWYLSFRKEGESDRKDDVPVKLRGDLVDSLPVTHQGSVRTYTVERRFFDRIFLAAGSPLREEDRGKYRQRMLRAQYVRDREKPLRNAVFYNCYHGRQFSDSPRAIYEELVRRGTDVEHIWGTNDQQAVVPPGMRTVEWKSAEWHEALATSRFLVTNVMISSWIKRREDQLFIQTWHGTPLKKMGADLLGTSKANPAYIATLPGRFEQFEYLTSPNAFTTPIMRSAFGFPNEILECGYPRNDVFYREDREEIADRVRKTLRLPEGKKVLLYTPTWRDDQRFGTGKKFKLDLQLDLAEFERALGDEYVLLFRKHPKMLNNITGARDGFVRDVAAYAEISDLYLVSDVLITDYSSSMFDFAHTGRPMVFFTYDLEHYRDTLRGFYFDFTGTSPGPLVKTTAELIDSLQNLDTVSKEYADRYAAFVKKFCEPADGLATAQVVDRMLDWAKRQQG